MTPDMQADGERLGRIWDAWQSGRTPSEADDAGMLAAIRDLEAAMQVPAPSAELISGTWEQIVGAPLPLGPYARVPAAAITANGHHRPVVAAPVTLAPRQRWIMSLAALWRLAMIGVVAGFAGGFLVGIWTRVAMRLSGFLTVDSNKWRLTENNAAVGEITLGGTLSIALVGAVMGMIGGLLYMGLRRWLPGQSWRRPLAYGVLLLAVFGFIVMDPGNPDYRLFGPPWVNVGTFSLAYVLFGLVAGLLADALDRRVPSHVLPSRRWLRAVAVISTVPLVALAGLAMLTVIIILFDTSAVLGGGLIGTLLVAVVGPRLIDAFALHLPAPGRRFWYITGAVPGLIGFAATVRNIIEIMRG